MLDLILKQAGESEPGFARKTVKWAITCTAEGRYTGVVPLGEGKGRVFENCPNLSQPELVGGGEARAHFLAEGLPTVALYFDGKTEDKDKEKFAAKHDWFVKLLRQASEDAPYLAAAANLLVDNEALIQIQGDLKQSRAKPTETAVVLVEGLNPLEQTDWNDWWRQFRATLRPGKTTWGMKMRCIVTGVAIEPVPTQPKVKGLAGVGGLGTGDVLAGFDKAAFQSFGLKQAANAAMSETVATAYTETLNRLIAEKNVKLGNTVAVYWFTGEVAAEDDALSWIVEPREQTAGAAERKAHDLLVSIRTGQRADLAGSRFVALLLSGASGRAMVRDVMQGGFESLTLSVGRWFDDLSITNLSGEKLASLPGIESVITAALPIRKPKQDYGKWFAPAGHLVRPLWRAAANYDEKIPPATIRKVIPILATFIIQFMDEYGKKPEKRSKEYPLMCSLLYRRMALIKAFLIRNQGDANMQPYLNAEHPHPAYHCGRAVAMFSRIQNRALGNVGAGVVQRYYTSATQMPGLIFGKLASSVQPHIDKIRKEAGPELANWYENQLADIMSSIGDAIPRTLTLEEQSLFALGYYQQLAAINAGNKGKSNTESTTEQ